MQRTITVSTDVFAAIWADRKEGEENENEILRRKFGCSTESAVKDVEPTLEISGGVHDTRNGVHFPRGFVAFRRYKRRDYEAVASDGSWLRKDTGESFPTLNQLNKSITAGPENVWNGNWKFRDESGTIQPLDFLRRTQQA